MFPSPHASWVDKVPTLLIMDEGSNGTYGEVERNKVVTIQVARPETLSIRRNNEAQIRRREKTTGIVLLLIAAILSLLPVAIEDVWMLWGLRWYLPSWG